MPTAQLERGQRNNADHQPRNPDDLRLYGHVEQYVSDDRKSNERQQETPLVVANQLDLLASMVNFGALKRMQIPRDLALRRYLSQPEPGSQRRPYFRAGHALTWIKLNTSALPAWPNPFGYAEPALANAIGRFGKTGGLPDGLCNVADGGSPNNCR